MRNIVVDLDSIMKPCKPYADSTLQNMKKSELIEYVRILENNCDVAVAALNQQAENVKDWEPVVHAHWETLERRNIGIKSRCSHCMNAGWNLHKNKRCPNCGAKMKDGV